MSTSFTSVAASAEQFLAEDRDLTIALSGTFVATILLEQAQGGGGSWKQIRRYTGTATDTISLPRGRYRLSCIAFTSGTATYVIGTAARTVAEQRDANGKVQFAIDGDGKLSGLAGIEGVPMGQSTPAAAAFTLLNLASEDALTAHAGGTQAAALALDAAKSVHRVTTVATAADSVKLPAATVGAVHIVINDAASNSMQVFGSGTDTINGVATATGVAQAAGKTALFVCPVAGKWLRLLSG